MIELFSFDFRNGGPRLLAAGFRSLAFLFFSTNRKRRLLWNVTFFFVLHSVDQSMMNIMRKKGKRALFFTKKELFNGSRSDLGDRWNMSALPDFCCGSFFLFVVEAFHFHCVYWSPLFICVLFFFLEISECVLPWRPKTKWTSTKSRAIRTERATSLVSNWR